MQSLELRNCFLQVTEEDYHRVIAKYDMTDIMVGESMESIRQWYKMQPHLPAGALSDDRLFRHLLAVSFSMEKAKSMIDNMITACTIMPDLMQNRNPCAEWAQRTREYTRIAVLPQLRREDMTRILLIDFTERDPADFSMVNVIKMFNAINDFRLCADITLGEHYIVDFRTTKLGHVVAITPALVKKSIFFMQSCFGAKIKGIHYVNVPPYAEYVIALVKAGMSKKLAARIRVYKDNASLHKVIPKSILPKEMGGDEKSMDELTAATLSEMCKPKQRQWFIEQDQFKTDESKRLGIKSDMSNELLGMHGSFRALDID